jgi:hypothetical protein
MFVSLLFFTIRSIPFDFAIPSEDAKANIILPIPMPE